MSDAKRCDRCGSLYEVRKGTLALDVHIATGGDTDGWNGWSEIDFCQKCGDRVLEAIGMAINRNASRKNREPK